MTVTKSRAVAAPARPARKSPLRAATLGGMTPVGPGLTTAEILTAGTGLRREAVPAPDLRRMQISEFTAWLRSRTNKHHRPFQADTVFGRLAHLPGLAHSRRRHAATSPDRDEPVTTRMRKGSLVTARSGGRGRGYGDAP